MEKVITRYAPSPTGHPHVGNIRTAIFAYLWARKNKGSFLLRIEDTDRERIVPGAVASIEQSLTWLGINYDQEMVYQSERRETHQKAAEELVAKGLAYRCYCTKERLTELRDRQSKEKLPPGYDGYCRSLKEAEIAKFEDKNTPYVIRFKMPQDGDAIWDDAIRGQMKIAYKVSDDPVIMKSDGWPTYHLASVVDDHDSGVTDVIRGEEWISSTPKHLALYEAFGWDAPRFAHMPHINGPDGAKLSKRHGDTALLDYREQGYLPEAMLNFLVLLGWNDGTEKEIFSIAELVNSFDLARIGKSPSVFDIEKLRWMNGQYIRALGTDELSARIATLLPNSKIIKAKTFNRILEVEKSRLDTLCDIEEGTDFYLEAPSYKKEMLIFKKSDKLATLKGLETALGAIQDNAWPDTVDAINAQLSTAVNKAGLTNGDLFWPVRVALSGAEKSASPAELLWALGKEESIKRLTHALNLLH